MLSRFLVLCALGVLAITSAVPDIAAGQARPNSFCPEMTDSIRRLHLALLGTEPSREEFDAQVSAYQTGTRALPHLAKDLLASDQFQAKGITTDDAFIQFIVGQTLGRNPDEEERNYWTSALAGGYERSLAVLTYTESAEYVDISGTETPLSGFLRWYPEGTQWRCNVGQTTIREPISPLSDQTHADYLVHNSGESSDTIRITTTNDDGSTNTTMLATRLAGGYTDFVWEGSFSGDGSYGTGLMVEAGPATSWIVVLYPGSIGPDRPGWQLV